MNTANPHPVVGAGADTAIHDKAGPQLLAARKQIGDIPRGHAAITPVFGLSAKYVIHTVGPVWKGDGQGELETLRSCYASSLSLADEHKCESIAFPLISSGNYGFPKNLALQAAISTISEFLMKSEMMVYLVVFDKTAYSLSEKLFQDVASYIDENLIEEVYAREYRNNAADFERGRDLERSRARRYLSERRRQLDECAKIESNEVFHGMVSFDMDFDEEASCSIPEFLWEDSVCAPSEAPSKDRKLEDLLIQLEET